MTKPQNPKLDAESRYPVFGLTLLQFCALMIVVSLAIIAAYELL